jgi:hypothetical protein
MRLGHSKNRGFRTGGGWNEHLSSENPLLSVLFITSSWSHPIDLHVGDLGGDDINRALLANCIPTSWRELQTRTEYYLSSAPRL